MNDTSLLPAGELARIRKRDLVDEAALDQALHTLQQQGGERLLTGETRQQLLRLFREVLTSGRHKLHQAHLQRATGRFIVKNHCYLMDLLLARLFRLVMAPPLAAPGTPSLCVVATGGYGREELAPFSDIDLLFLLPDGMHPELGLRVEQMLYFLWDLGLEVGHAVRNIEECVARAESDLEIRTSLLESRFLAGDPVLFGAYHATLFQEVLLKDPEAFLLGKLEEQRVRHERFGNSLFYLEPNIKENPGGLRDIHTFFWISKYRYRVDKVKELIPRGIITIEEYLAFTRCRELLWRVRNALHYRAGRREDRLTFNHQLEIAAEFGYHDRPGLRGVEQFMRRYYQVATQVGNLSQIFLAQYQEEHRPKDGGDEILIEDVFQLVGDKVRVTDPQAFQVKPCRLMRLFQVAQRQGRAIHPHTLRLVTQNLKLVDARFREDATVNAIFLGLLRCGGGGAAWALRAMNSCGLLGRYLPEFGRITGQTQHDLYHVFTVDEHTILAVDALSAIRKGEFAQELPISTKLMAQLTDAAVLHLAVLFHDIGKGRGGEHALKGAVLARQICQRLGLGRNETDLVYWLVENHLLYSRTAFRRDINEPETVVQFARQVGEKRRLDLLALLTVADIRAVGPGVWTQWKASLLRRLYLLTLEAITKGVFGPEEMAALAEHQKCAVAEILYRYCTQDKVDVQLERFYPDYFLSYDAESLAGYYLAMAPHMNDPLALVFRSSIDSDTTDLVIHTQDHPGLMAKISGAIASGGANILAANINTTKDGMALDIFTLQDPQGGALNSTRQLNRIEEALRLVLTDQARPEALLAKASNPTARKREPFTVPPLVTVDNNTSDTFTVVEVTAKDRVGLLFVISRELQRQGIQVRSAKIATYGERAVDVFYVRDLFGLKLNQSRAHNLTKGLLAALQALEQQEPPA